MKAFFLIAGVIVFGGSLVLGEFNLREISVYQSGVYVTGIIVNVPNCISSGRHYNITISIFNRNISRKVGIKKCHDVRVGDPIVLKTNAQHEIFLFQDENPYIDLVAVVLLGVFGLFLIGYSFHKKSSSTNLQS